MLAREIPIRTDTNQVLSRPSKQVPIGKTIEAVSPMGTRQRRPKRGNGPDRIGVVSSDHPPAAQPTLQPQKDV